MADTARMRLAFDTVGARFGGTAIVARDVVAASLRCPDVDHVLVFATARPARQFEFPNDPRVEVVELGRLASSGAARIAWQLSAVGVAARRRSSDLLIGLANGGVGGKVPTAVFLQQALPFAPEVLAGEPMRARARMVMIREVMRASARRAVAVGVQTEAMRDAVVNRLRLSPSRVHVFMPTAPTFPDAALVPALDAVPRGRRVLYVGTDLTYKNLDLARAAARLADATLFVTADVLATPPSVVSLRGLGRAELRAVYEGCDVLVMPSRCESLGLPLLEGMRLGVPIVTLDKPYAREVCGQAALYVADDPAEMASALRTLLADSGLRAKLADAGRERVARLDGERAYEKMLRTFVHAAGLRGVEYL